VAALVENKTQELREQERRLMRAQKLESVGRLAGGIAHDFNNLLGAIQGFASVGHERLHASDPLRDDLEQILRACDRGALLVSQLLAFGRKQVVKPQVVDVAALILDLQKMLRRVIGENIELETRFAPDVGRVQADPGQLEQVLVNLVVNAREAMPKGGALTIEAANVSRAEAQPPADVAAADAYVQITVADTGTGMDQETQARMFEPFFTTRQGRGGSGLGLASVYGIVSQGRGHIHVTSQPGQGTRVSVYLPRTAAPASDVPVRAERAPEGKGKETVLVVEDDDQIRQLACRVLREAGYTVLEAARGDEALAVCEQHAGPLHLLLTDVVMPRMNGVELASHVLHLRPTVRVAFMSGYSVEAEQYDPLPADALLIEKPFVPRTLLARLRELLDRPGR